VAKKIAAKRGKTKFVIGKPRSAQITPRYPYKGQTLESLFPRKGQKLLAEVNREMGGLFD